MVTAECRYRRGVWAAVAGAWLLLGLPAAAAAADVTGAQVKRALAAGVRALKARQQGDGSWAEQRGYAGGETCLATLALLQAGEPVASREMTAALRQIRSLPDQQVYVVSLKIMVLAQADPQRFGPEIEHSAEWLVKAQTKFGLWSYTQAGGNFDHSNSQFALLGLHAAAQAGVRIPNAVWQRAQNAVLNTQNRDGGWTYRQRGDSYGSMTAAGISDLIIFGHRVTTGLERNFRDGKAPGCGRHKLNKPLAGGLGWLGAHFRADQNPGRRRSWLHYWLYAVERCGILSGRKSFGRHDWYREGAAHLVRTQEFGGTWGGVVDTAFAVLFLAKGHKPLLVQKLQWSADEAWNPDPHDLEHLISYVGDKLGEPTAWQVVDFDAPLEDWLAAPLLYMQGHEFPNWNAEQRAKVREYVEQGGTLLAEACCGSREFRKGFGRFAAETFPEVPLRELDVGHPVYHTLEDAKPYGLMGIDLGCRTSIVFSPKDLSCLWQQGDVPRLSEQAFALGLNIAAYAVGRRPLRDRLDVVTLPTAAEDEAAGPPSGDALRLAQIVYDGDWRPDAQALVKLAEALRDDARLDVVTRYKAVRLTDEDLYTCPILFMTGHYEFELSQEEREALAAHLSRGGFLLAEACCGRDAFDGSFREMVRATFPEGEFKRLGADHPIFRGEPGFDVRSVEYKPALLREQPGLTEPRLWGLELDGRLAIVYSPYSLGCGLEGHVCHNCRGLTDESARRLATNVVLYALTH